MHYQIKTLFQVKYEDIHKVVHPYLLSAYYQKTRLMSCLDDYDILLVEQLPFFDGVLDPSGNIRYDVDFTLRGHLNYLIKQHQLGGNKVRHVGGAYRPVVEQPKPEKEQADTKENRRRDAYQAMVSPKKEQADTEENRRRDAYQAIVSPKKELSKHEKKHGVTKKTINAMSPTIEEMLANPELDGISSVNIDPVSMAVETVVDLIEDVKEFIEKPSLSGIAAMAVTAIPGKYADKVLDELPVKKIFSSYEFKAPSGISQKVYQQDIDWDLNVNTRSGVKTNLELVQNGRSPFVIKDGKYSQINLHHSKQNSRGALFELSAKTHQKYYGSNSLHPYLPSKHPINPVDRDIFNVDRDAYWIERGNNEIKKR